jgi:hypothetical protein
MNGTSHVPTMDTYDEKIPYYELGSSTMVTMALVYAQHIVIDHGQMTDTSVYSNGE